MLALVALVACASPPSSSSPSSPSSPSSSSSPSSTGASVYDVNGVDVDRVLDSLTPDEKVGQLLLLGFGGTKMDGTIAKFLDEMKPGGLALFSRNIDTPEQTLKLIRDVREHDPHGVPMFVAVDQEGGNVVRVKTDATVLPSAMALGAAHDPELARRAGQALGRDLRIFGFNMNLAPVLDVNSNPDNPVIGIRSFGEHAGDVADLGIAYVDGMQSEGVLAVAKHFPGHGDTDADSHYHLPILPHDKQRLDDVELFPFAKGFAEGLDAIMTAHIALPALASPDDAERNLPATLNPRVLTGILRNELGYDGLVITDGLEMQGIVQRFGAGEAAVRAINAGADVVMVLWYPEKKREVRDSLLAAVESGRIPAWRLDQAVRRVLVAKAERGIFGRSLLPEKEALAELRKADRSVVNEIAQRAITVVKNDSVLPLSSSKKIAVASTEPLFAEMLAKKLGAKTVALQLEPTKERTAADAQKLVDIAHDADIVVVAMETLDHRAIVERVKQQLPQARVVVVSFGSPYLLSRLPPVDAYVCAFGWREESERAAALAMVDELKATGRLPVTVATTTKSASK